MTEDANRVKTVIGSVPAAYIDDGQEVVQWGGSEQLSRLLCCSGLPQLPRCVVTSRRPWRGEISAARGRTSLWGSAADSWPAGCCAESVAAQVVSLLAR
jgi:hypothetical protein